MPVLQNIQKIIDQLKGGLQNAIGANPGPLRPEDVVTLQQGPQENRGFGNIVQNVSLIGAQKRAAQEQLKESDEDRAAKLDLQKAQAENLRSLGPYRQNLVDLSGERNRISKLRADVYGARTTADIEVKKAELLNHQEQAKAAMLSAEARMKSTVDAAVQHQATLEFQRAKFAYDEVQDVIDNDLKRQTIAIQGGFLGIARERAPSEIAHTEASTANLTADTERKAREAADQPLTEAGHQLKVILDAQRLNPTDDATIRNMWLMFGLNKTLGPLPSTPQGLGTWIKGLFGGSPEPTPLTTPTPPTSPIVPPITPVKTPVKPPVKTTPVQPPVQPSVKPPLGGTRRVSVIKAGVPGTLVVEANLTDAQIEAKYGVKVRR
jgi:hypothetical protein